MSIAVEAPPRLTTLPCKHCGEPSVVAKDGEDSDAFCCPGCRGAYNLIRGLGLDHYYSVRDKEPLGPIESETTDSPDQEAELLLEQGHSAVLQDGSQQVQLAIQGIHCGACSWLIENALMQQPGINGVRVRMNDHSVELNFHNDTISLGKIAAFIKRLGYRLVPFDPSSDAHLQTENSTHLTRIAFSGFLAANTMWIAIALYAGASAEYGYFLGLAGATLGLISLIGPGRVFLVGALAAIRTRTPHMDMPVALGLTAGTLVGSYNAIRGIGHVYFDSIAALVFLLSIGRWLQFRQQQRAAKAVELMLRLTPQHANRIQSDGSRVKTPVGNLKSNDIIEVLSGECIPVDGCIIKCSDTPRLDCSLLTGESDHVKVAIGGNVAAGTINSGLAIQIQVHQVGKETRLGQILQSVETAVRERTPIVMLADRVGGYFVLGVTVLAIAAFYLWLGHGVDVALTYSTALLIVACPCALALATPLAIAVGLGRAAKRGILIRDGSAFQHLASSGKIWLDKTGTLTEGKQQVTSVLGNPDLLRAAAILELECEHPIATAIRRKARLEGLALTRIARDVKKDSNGISGSVDDEQIAIGNADYLRGKSFTIPAELLANQEEILDRGESPVFIAANGQVETLLGLSDPIRQETPELIDELKRRAWQVGILSGDHREIVERVGRKLGIAADRCLGGMTPEEKLAIIETSKASSQVVMVGDGANDAAALAAADVGLAVRGGAEASLHAAPVFLSNGPGSLKNLLSASSRVQRMIYLTFAVSLAYNLFAVTLAMGGWITPLIAAVLMPISSLSVLALTISGRTFEDSP